MSTNITPAEVFLGLGGKIFCLVGLGFISVGGIYGVNKISTSAIRIIESLPFLLKLKDVREEDKNLAIITKQQIVKGFSSYASIAAVIVLGGLIGYAGRFMSSESTIASANSFIYRT